MADELLELGRRRRRRCPPGKILRKGFTTRRGVTVRPACVPDTGAPGKTPAARRILPKPEPGEFRGWAKNQPPKTRRRAVREIVDREGCAAAIRKLTLLRNLSADPGTKRAAKQDADWVREQGFCVLVTKERAMGRRSRRRLGRRSNPSHY